MELISFHFGRQPNQTKSHRTKQCMNKYTISLCVVYTMWKMWIYFSCSSCRFRFYFWQICTILNASQWLWLCDIDGTMWYTLIFVIIAVVAITSPPLLTLTNKFFLLFSFDKQTRREESSGKADKTAFRLSLTSSLVSSEVSQSVSQSHTNTDTDTNPHVATKQSNLFFWIGIGSETDQNMIEWFQYQRWKEQQANLVLNCSSWAHLSKQMNKTICKIKAIYFLCPYIEMTTTTSVIDIHSREEKNISQYSAGLGVPIQKFPKNIWINEWKFTTCKLQIAWALRTVLFICFCCQRFQFNYNHFDKHFPSHTLTRHK